MSFDEYVNHMSQKYRLAVAISVIKSKPNNLSIEEYLTQLQNKINMETDPNETVCSDDFNFDDDFITNEEVQQSTPNINENEYNCKSNEKYIDCFANENDSQSSQTILKDFVFNGDAGRDVPCIVEDTHIGDTIALLKGVTNCTKIEEQPFIYQQDLSQTTFCESQEEPYISGSDNITFCYSINNNVTNNLTEHTENNIDSQETELYTLQGLSQSSSHVSQTQGEHFVIDAKFIRSKVSNDIAMEITQDDNVFNCIQYCQNDERAQTNTYKNLVQNKKADIEENMNYKDIEKCIEITNYEALANEHQTQGDGNNTIFENNQDVNTDNFNEVCNEMDSEDSDHDSQAETVPFKVLEELNKVRAFLNKRDERNTGYSTDSGYRSDSQIRSSFRSSQLSGVWLNQSAHCLFSFIMRASSGSDDITNKISQVLGQLIDKLHDEENYPSFLEELLETVDNLITDTHEGGSFVENVLITKDENLHRLILLTKSKHILKHCIENITNILEKLHLNLTNENLYELTNISEIENACYIFHMLEIFLKRYMRVRNISSQASTQSSQDEERFPKRSSLTDLWRKKWNPNYKEVSKSQENITVCVLKRCSEVLNRIVVGFMDGYSLVAFAALQCFNLIQS